MYSAPYVCLLQGDRSLPTPEAAEPHSRFRALHAGKLGSERGPVAVKSACIQEKAHVKEISHDLLKAETGPEWSGSPCFRGRSAGNRFPQ